MASSRRPTSLMQNESSGCCSSTFALSPSTADGHASRTAGTNAHGNAALGTAGLKSQGIPAPAAQSRTAAASPPNAFAHFRKGSSSPLPHPRVGRLQPRAGHERLVLKTCPPAR